MRLTASLSLGILGSLVFTAPYADAASITGTVKGPDGAPFRGAFVQARNAKTHITVSVLSDPQGHFQVPDLAAGDYRVSIHAPGFKADPKSGIALTADQNLTQDIALQKSFVRWSESLDLAGQDAAAGYARQGPALHPLHGLPWLRVAHGRSDSATKTAGAIASTT